MTTKTCPRCGSTKEATEFNKDRHASDGLRTYCKTCDSKIATKAERLQRKQTPRVYMMMNTMTYQFYVGSTTMKLKKRYWKHRSSANAGCQSELYHCMRLFDSKDHWRIECLEALPGADKKTLRQREQAYIDVMNPPLNTINAIKEA